MLAPAPILKAITVVGTTLKQAQPSIQSIIISFVAVSLFLLPCILSIAQRARGVVAFAIPRTEALTQAVISSVATFSSKARGNTSLKTGDKSLEAFEITPPSFKTDIIPFQSAIIPTRERQIVTLFDAPSKILSQRDFILPVIAPNIKEIIQRTEKHLPSIIYSKIAFFC